MTLTLVKGIGTVGHKPEKPSNYRKVQDIYMYCIVHIISGMSKRKTDRTATVYLNLFKMGKRDVKGQ